MPNYLVSQQSNGLCIRALEQFRQINSYLIEYLVSICLI
jgi:hypothetical protein